MLRKLSAIGAAALLFAAAPVRAAAEDVREGIVPDSGHWIMEENPTATIKLVRDFLESSR